MKGANKDAKIYVEGPRPCTVFSVFFAPVQCMNYVTDTFLLVSSHYGVLKKTILLC